MLKQNMTLDILSQADHCLKEKVKKIIGLLQDELGGPIIKDFVGLGAKTYNYLKGNNDEDKEAKGTKKVCHKKPLNFKIMKTVQKQLKLKII